MREAEEEALRSLGETPDHPLLKSSLAELYLRQDRLIEARIMAEEVLAQDPRQVQALAVLGDVFLKQHSPKGALECYRQAFSRDPKPYLNLRIARTLKEMKNYKGALEELEKVLVAKPESLSFLKEKALVLNRMEKFDEALRVYEKVKEADPKDTFVQKEIIRLRGRTQARGQGVKELRAVAAMDSRKDDPQIHGLLGQKLKEAGMIREAAEEYAAASSLEPKNVFFLKQRGFCHYHLKEYGPALQLLGEAFRKDPTDFAVRNTLQKIYKDQDNPKGFLDLLEDAHRMHPESKPLLGMIKKLRKNLGPPPGELEEKEGS